MASPGGQAAVAHAGEISTGGAPVVLIAEDDKQRRLIVASEPPRSRPVTGLAERIDSARARRDQWSSLGDFGRLRSPSALATAIKWSFSAQATPEKTPAG